MKKKLYLLVFLLAASIFDLKAQVKINGLVQNEEHVGIEYATICVDSIFTLTDKEGRLAFFSPAASVKSSIS